RGRAGGLRRAVGAALPGDREAVAGPLERVHPVPGVPAGGAPGHLYNEPDRVNERPAAESDPQPRPVPLRAGRPQSPLPGGAQPRGIPPPQRRDPQLRMETSPSGLHHLLRGPDPHPMKTATITYTDDRTLPPGEPLEPPYR